jgi:hypothetical protein
VLLGPPDVNDTPPEFDDIPDSGLTVVVTTTVSVVRMVDRAGQFVTVVGQLMIVETRGCRLSRLCIESGYLRDCLLNCL